MAVPLNLYNYIKNKNVFKFVAVPKSKYIKSKYIKSKYIKSKYISWYVQFTPQKFYPYNIILSYNTLKILTKFKHKFRMRSVYRFKSMYCLNNNFMVSKKNSYYAISLYSHKNNVLRYIYNL